MALRLCLGNDGQSCTRLTDHPGSRCPEHRHQRERARPSARARGYDYRHDMLRALLLPLAYGKDCPRCGKPMLRGQDLDLGHPDDRPRSRWPGSRADRIEHAHCNRVAGAS